MKQAQDFSLPDQHGKKRTLEDYKGKWVVLYFYLEDHTPGCTKEACSFRDANEALLARDAVVLGISNDSVQSHADFIAGYKLPFTLLSDPERKAITAYDAWDHSAARTIRKTFIIDPKGKIVKEYPNVTPAEHATQILNDLITLQAA